jgi:transitional endoplasmic reticulum ATPase
MEPFTLIEETSGSSPYHLFDDVVELSSAKTADHDLQYVKSLRKANPDMIVTSIPGVNVNLRAFAASGYASCELDTDNDSFSSWRGFLAPATRSGRGNLAEQIHFARYTYKFGDDYFILVRLGHM